MSTLICARVVDAVGDPWAIGAVIRPCDRCGELVLVARTGQVMICVDRIICIPCFKVEYKPGQKVEEPSPEMLAEAEEALGHPPEICTTDGMLRRLGLKPETQSPIDDTK